MARKFSNIQQERIKLTGESSSTVKRDLIAKINSAKKPSSLINENELEYKGTYPSVFKKVDSSDFKKEQFITNKLFTFLSGSVTSSVFTVRSKIY
jgi:hypothetical protein